MVHAALANMMNVPTILIVILVIVLLFGANKIPELMRSMGSGIKEFKKGMAEGEGGEQKPAEPPKPQEAAKPAEAQKPAEPPKA
jgi:sec-independent protein translocase protein TatA